MSETKVTDLTVEDANESVSKNLKRNCDETGIFQTIRLANYYVKGLCVDASRILYSDILYIIRRLPEGLR